MAEIKVVPSVHNAGDNRGLIAELVRQHNDISARFNALMKKLDLDSGTDSDYESGVGVADTIAYQGGGTPA